MTGHVVTFTGKAIEPLNPDPSLICIEDVAHALANSCRFTGHVREFYSVAQHSVYVSQIVAREFALVGLLHDASEAYLSDIARPVKQQPEFGTVYKAAEERLMFAVAERFGFDWPMPDVIRHADDVLLRSEQRDLMPPLLHIGGDDFLPYMIEPWAPRIAERRFLLAYHGIVGYSVLVPPRAEEGPS